MSGRNIINKLLKFPVVGIILHMKIITLLIMVKISMIKPLETHIPSQVAAVVIEASSITVVHVGSNQSSLINPET